MNMGAKIWLHASLGYHTNFVISPRKPRGKVHKVRIFLQNYPHVIIQNH